MSRGRVAGMLVVVALSGLARAQYLPPAHVDFFSLMQLGIDPGLLKEMATLPEGAELAARVDDLGKVQKAGLGYREMKKGDSAVLTSLGEHHWKLALCSVKQVVTRVAPPGHADFVTAAELGVRPCVPGGGKVAMNREYVGRVVAPEKLAEKGIKGTKKGDAVVFAKIAGNRWRLKLLDPRNEATLVYRPATWEVKKK